MYCSNLKDILILSHLKTVSDLEKIKKTYDDTQEAFNEYKRHVQMNNKEEK